MRGSQIASANMSQIDDSRHSCGRSPTFADEAKNGPRLFKLQPVEPGFFDLPNRAEDPMLRQLHALLKEKDPSFDGRFRVQNKGRRFLWVHEKFVGEY